MKKLSLFVFLLFSFVQIFAQNFDKCYAKKGEKHILYHIIRGDKDKYYKVYNDKNQKFWSVVDKGASYLIEFHISKNKYDAEEVGETEITRDDVVKLCSTSNFSNSGNLNNNYSESTSVIVLAKDEVLVRKIESVKVTSSSPHEYGMDYPIFRVVKAEDKSLIGDEIVCKIVEKRKSNLSGAEGRLTIRPLYIIDSKKGKIRLMPTDIFLRGKNRANVKTWFQFPVFPLFFIAGSGAELPGDTDYVFYIK
jgi:hypothetical protein